MSGSRARTFPTWMRIRLWGLKPRSGWKRFTPAKPYSRCSYRVWHLSPKWRGARSRSTRANLIRLRSALPPRPPAGNARAGPSIVPSRCNGLRSDERYLALFALGVRLFDEDQVAAVKRHQSRIVVTDRDSSIPADDSFGDDV